MKYLYKKTKAVKKLENTSVDDCKLEDGVSTSECPLIVHGLMGKDIINKSWKVLSAKTLKHVKDGGSVLAIGHSLSPESIYNNPALYPQMFPWLFLYDLGGIGNKNINKKISSQKQRAHLLLYHNKRFQTNRLFPIVAFNLEQLQATSTGGFLLTKKSMYKNVCANIIRGYESGLFKRLKQRNKLKQQNSSGAVLLFKLVLAFLV